MAIYSGFSHWKWWFSIAMLVYQRVDDLIFFLGFHDGFLIGLFFWWRFIAGTSSINEGFSIYIAFEYWRAPMFIACCWSLCKIIGETKPDFGWFKNRCLLGKIFISCVNAGEIPGFFCSNHSKHNFVCLTPKKFSCLLVNSPFPFGHFWVPSQDFFFSDGTSVNCKSITWGQSLWWFGPNWDFLTKVMWVYPPVN